MFGIDFQYMDEVACKPASLGLVANQDPHPAKLSHDSKEKIEAARSVQ